MKRQFKRLVGFLFGAEAVPIVDHPIFPLLLLVGVFLFIVSLEMTRMALGWMLG